MKKRFLAVVLCAAMVASMTGCGSTKISNEYITISQYKGLEIEKVSTEVTEDDVTSYIDSQLASLATDVIDVPDRVAQSGDKVSLDFAATDDAGKAIDGTTATDQTLELGSGSFIAGWEEQCIGKPFGQEFTFDLAFPEDYSATELAGVNAHWTVTMHGIVTGQNTPKLTDDVVTQFSTKSKTVDDYKKEIKKTLEDQAKDSAETTLQNEIWEAITKKTEVKKYPDGKVEDIMEEYKKYYESMATQYGMSYSEFLSSYGMSEEDFDSQMKTSAQEQVTKQLITELILKKARITLSEKDYTKKYEEFAKQYGYTTEDGNADVDALLKAATEDTLKEMVEEAYASEWLLKYAKQVEPKKEDQDKQDGTDATTTDGATTDGTATEENGATTDQNATDQNATEQGVDQNTDATNQQ